MRQHILYRSLLTGLLVLSLTPRGYAEKNEAGFTRDRAHRGGA